MANLEELLQWCNQARALLKSSGSKKGKAALKFDAALNKLTIALGKLTALTPDAAAVKALREEFEELAASAKELAERATVGGESESELRTEAKKLTGELDTLTTAMNKALPNAQERARYVELMATCRKRKLSLETFPYADVSDVNNVINGAVLGTSAMDDPALIKRALAALSGFDAAVKLAEGKQKKGAETAQRNVEAERGCLERLRVVQQTLANAKNSFVPEEQIQKLQAAINRANTAIEGKRWTEALAALNARDLPDGRSILTSSQQTLRTLPQQPLKDARAALLQYKLLVDDASYADAEQRMNRNIAEALEMDPRSAASQMDGVVVQITSKVNAATQMKRDLEGHVRTIGDALEHTKARMPVDEHLALTGEFERLKADIAQRRLEASLKRAPELNREVASAQVDANQEWAAWNKVAAEYPKALTTLRGHATVEGGTPDARNASAQLVLAAGDSRKNEMLAARDWAGLVALYGQMLKGIEDFNNAKKNYAGRDAVAARGEADRLVQEAIGAAQSALTTTGGVLRKAPGVEAGPVLEPFEKRLAQLQQRWTAQLANATEVNAAQLAEAMVAEFKLLEADITAAADPTVVTATGDQQASEKQRKAFESEAQALPALLQKLDHLDPKSGQGYADRLTALRSDDKTPWADRMEPLRALLAEARLTVQNREKARPQQNSEMVERCRLLDLKLKTERGKLKSTGDKTFEPLFTELADELADLRLLASTPNLEVVTVNKGRLDAVAKKLEGIEGLSKGGGSAFKPVRDELGRLDATLEQGEAELQENLPKTLTSLRQLMNTLKTEVLSMTPADALDEISALKVSINVARTEAAKVALRRKDFTDLVPLVTSKIEALGREGTVPAYVEALKKRLTEAKQQAKDPYKLTLAKQMLDQLHRDVEKAFVDPKAGLEMQQAALAEAERLRLLQLQCESHLASIKKTGRARAQKAVDDAGGDPGLMQELGRMIDMAGESVKTQDHAEAQRRLALIDKRIQEIEADPYGPGVGSRKALPDDAKLFSASTKKLVEALSAFPGQVATSLPEMKEPVKQKLAKQVADLVKRLNPEQFLQPAMELSDAKQPVRRRRELRESALERVRTARSLLNDHPQFAALWANPIHVELRVIAAEVNQRLMRLEANIRRAVH